MAVIAFAAVLGWFGWSRLQPPRPAEPQMVSRDPPGKTPGPVASPPPTAPPAPAAQPPGAEVAASAAGPGQPAASLSPPPAAPGAAEVSARPAAGAGPPGPAAALAPGFDVVRVEPGGDSVIAGRTSPRARVRLLDNGREVAALSADDGGQFVILPPPLAAGSHELVLQVEGQGGAVLTSPQSVTVVVADRRDQPPLVTLTSPGEPSMILSRPDAPASLASRGEGDRPVAGAPAASAVSAASAVPARSGAEASSAPAPAPTPAASPPRIVSVESEGAGRLYVSGTVPPSASVRLYLNDAFVAAAAAAPDGRLAFAIESGIRPGDYRVRLDVVDGATGAVRSRAEVPFAMPAPASAAGGPAIPLPPPAPGRATTVASGPAASAAVSPTSPAAASGAGAGAASGPAAPVPAAVATNDAPPVPPAGGGRGGVADPAAPLPRAGTASSWTAGRPDLPGAVPPLATVLAPPSASVGALRVAEAGAASPQVTVVPEVNTATVTRGDSLWQISKRTYGDGLRYTVIFGANTPQIRDPNLIYPGQVFVLPTGEPVTVTR